MGANRSEVLKIGYFGSYARGDWGVGSDLDLVIVVTHSEARFEKRSMAWDATELPVPADVLVYTTDEWERLSRQSPFHQKVSQEVVWVHPEDPEGEK